MSRSAKLLISSIAGSVVAVGGAYVATGSAAHDLRIALAGTVSMAAEAQTEPDAVPQELALGRPASPEEVQAWDIDIRPDGAGLPEGSGDVWTGEEIYVSACASCHGDFGESIGRWPQLAGGQGTLTRDRPVKTIGSYWPYLSTVYDYVHRAMPFGNAQSLTDDEVYAVTAYLLYLNDLVEDDFVLDRETLSGFHLPNEDGFYDDDREETEFEIFTAEACMENCKETVEITARAEVVDVTPDDEAAREAREAASTDTSADSDAGGDAVVADAQVEVADASAAEVPATETVEATTPLAHTATDPDPELVAQGEEVFRQCKSCHQVGEGAKNRTGPLLNGIVGHPAGAIEGFRYSSALTEMADAGLVWDSAELDAFLAAPKDYMPGTKMSFRGLRDEEDRTAVIAYLQSIEE